MKTNISYRQQETTGENYRYCHIYAAAQFDFVPACLRRSSRLSRPSCLTIVQKANGTHHVRKMQTKVHVIIPKGVHIAHAVWPLSLVPFPARRASATDPGKGGGRTARNILPLLAPEEGENNKHDKGPRPGQAIFAILRATGAGTATASFD